MKDLDFVRHWNKIHVSVMYENLKLPSCTRSFLSNETRTIFPSRNIPPWVTKIQTQQAQGCKDRRQKLCKWFIKYNTMKGYSTFGSQTCVFWEEWHYIFPTSWKHIYHNLRVTAEICTTIEDLKDVGMVIYTILPFKFSFG